MSIPPKNSLGSCSKLYYLAISQTRENHSLSPHSTFLDFCQEVNCKHDFHFASSFKNSCLFHPLLILKEISL